MLDNNNLVPFISVFELDKTIEKHDNEKTRKKYNLNAQAFDATVMLIKLAIDRGVRLKEIYVDTLGSAKVHQERLSK
eukprot:Pgem_evm1s13985